MPGACCGGCAAVNDIIIIISLEAGVSQGRGTKRPPTEIQKGEGLEFDMSLVFVVIDML